MEEWGPALKENRTGRYYTSAQGMVSYPTGNAIDKGYVIDVSGMKSEPVNGYTNEVDTMKTEPVNGITNEAYKSDADDLTKF